MRTKAQELFLVRHGLTDWNEQGRMIGRSDVALNARGRAQAAAVASALRRFSPEQLIVSPQRRATETAAAIAESCGLTAEIDPAIDEVWLGDWQGKKFAELHDDPDALAYRKDPSFECAAVESLTALAERTAALLTRLHAAQARAVVLVSHGDPLRTLLTSLLGMPPQRLRSFALEPGSVSVVRRGHKQAQLAALNWRPADLYDLLHS